MKAAVYLRQSEDRDADQLAISRQRDDCHALCVARGWTPVDYVDNDTSAVGAKRKRPAWNRMLADIEAGSVQAVVCWDLDRLYREPIDLEYLIPLADRKQVALATVTGDVDLGTDTGRMYARIKGAVARAEIDRRSARQKRKGRQMAESGEHWASRRPFGYRDDGTLHPVESAALRRAYDDVLAGHSMWSICVQWNAMGLRTSLGNTWRSGTQLRKILHNPRNAGLRAYNGEVVGAAKWPAIVTEDVFQAVCFILDDPSRRFVSPGRKYLLVGIARCGECAKRDVVSTVDTAKAGTGKPVYRCRDCGGVSRQVTGVDDHITDLVVARLSQPDAEELLIDQQRPDLERLRMEAAALRGRLESLAIDFAEGELTSSQLKAASERLKAKLDTADAAMEDANRAQLFKGVVGKDAGAFPDLHLDRRRAIIEALMVVTINKTALRRSFDPASIVIEPKS